MLTSNPFCPVPSLFVRGVCGQQKMYNMPTIGNVQSKKKETNNNDNKRSDDENNRGGKKREGMKSLNSGGPKG